jgi:hypothetical protein
MTLVGFYQGLPANTLHDSKCRGFVQLIKGVSDVLQEEAVLACFQTCKLQDAVQGVALARDALRTTSVGVRQLCGFSLCLREALKMPPLFAGKTIVTD